MAGGQVDQKRREKLFSSADEAILNIIIYKVVAPN